MSFWTALKDRVTRASLVALDSSMWTAELGCVLHLQSQLFKRFFDDTEGHANCEL